MFLPVSSAFPRPRVGHQIVGAGLRLSCLGLSLGYNLELKERETRQKRERWNQDRILIKAQMFNNKIYAYKEREAIPSHAKFLVNLSEQPFSSNSPNSVC